MTGAATSAVRAACSQIAFRSAAVNPSAAWVRAGSQRQRSLGRVRSAASFPPPNHTGPPCAGGVASQRDGVSGDLAGVAGAEPLADQYPGPVQPGEELLLAGRPGGRGAGRPPEGHSRSFRVAAATGLL